MFGNYFHPNCLLSHLNSLINNHNDFRTTERLEGAYHGLEEVSLTMIPRKKK